MNITKLQPLSHQKQTKNRHLRSSSGLGSPLVFVGQTTVRGRRRFESFTERLCLVYFFASIVLSFVVSGL